jgi:3-oxoacyl-(acyl-carrier-protein) synthase/3-hydroxymyristoyl/3-hydroxydecanoyl-(acyl carrier protein) dehydratase
MSFPPIAIVGQGCVLPGAFSPDELWAHVAAGRDLLGPVPPGYWRVDNRRILVRPEEWAPEKVWSDRGGYVRDFDQVFDPEGFALPAGEILQMDEQFHWVLFAARSALRSRRQPGSTALARCGLVLGNLAYPTFALSEYAESVWRKDGGPRPHPRNRFHAGSIAHFTASALGLGAGAFALDAACASSLYALKLACDRLHDGRADLMLAGAVNRTDDLLIRAGFCALGALSRSGHSRPFHREADGLVPSEGAALVLLKRLEDAVADHDVIHGVIRGIGLSNDGRQGGFLSPSPSGQAAALRQAYRSAGLSPGDVSLVECHATGTAVGDRAELESLRAVFADCEDVPLGSLKSNLGHLITAAGAAGLLKVLAAFAAGVRPPTLHAEDKLEEIAAPFRLLQRPEPWTCKGTRRAALNAFGFGGANAHLIVEQWQPTSNAVAVPPLPPRAESSVAVVALAVRAGTLDTNGFTERLLGTAGPDAKASCRMQEIVLDASVTPFPPRDLARALPQQLVVLEVVQEATRQVHLPAETTAVLVGMQCDAEVARQGLRIRLPEWAGSGAQDAVAAPLEAATVVGEMPNISANRVNVQLDLRGPGFTVAGEELSGLYALDIAVRGLQDGEIDAAVVAAVDLCCEPVHATAAAEVLPADRHVPGDAAVALVLKRLADAERDGDSVLAVIRERVSVEVISPEAQRGEEENRLAEQFGHAHAATGLLCAAGAILSGREAQVSVSALGGQRATLRLQAPDGGFTPRLPEMKVPARFPLRFAAHLPEVVLPEKPVSPDMPSEEIRTGMEIMAPAPALVSVLEDLWSEPPQTSRVDVAVPHANGMQGPRPEDPARAVEELVSAQTRVFQGYLRHLHETQGKLQRTFERAAALIAGGGQQGSPPRPFPVAESGTSGSMGERRGSSPPGQARRLTPHAPCGPSFGREQLLELGSGKISAVFGPLFEQQDGYARQVRLPMPPLLLVDRVTGIDAEPGVLGVGTIWTETDVRWGEWYLQDGVMAAGVMIESGQADLTLISWMGADFQNRGERVYRLLGCDLTYHGSLPRPGETLCYHIHIDGHARQGDVRLFFFHYDCRVNGELRLTVRNGQAGFFTDQELAESAGILWTPETGEHNGQAPLAPPRLPCLPTSFDRDQVSAWFQGRPFDCFGAGYEMLYTHTRTPRGGSAPQAADAPCLQFFDEVTLCDSAGGPWGRGHLQARKRLSPDDWFFQGHFHNDACMPGTLMFEGTLQAMAFYLTWLGYTLDRDGWRFEPVQGQTYPLRCRGQVVPSSRELVYDLFIEEVHDGDEPRIYADLLVSVDGLKAFHCRRMGLRMVPDWPLGSMPELLAAHSDIRPFATVADVRGDYPSLLACAWGKPSDAFGSMYQPFDGGRRVPRLPGPPYHFLSRLTRIAAEPATPRPGASVTAEYDVVADAWYFHDHGGRGMPFCVLMEVNLQPCGWLASFLGVCLRSEEDLFFRNLDGTARVEREILPGAGTLQTKVTLTRFSEFGGMVIVSFETECRQGEYLVCKMETSFGFFTAQTLSNQVGLRPTPAEQARFEEPGNVGVDLTQEPARYFAGALTLPKGPLRMIDRITGYWPEGGKAGLGRLLSEQTVDPAAWYFKAHFYQDPVQPGSLGVEAMIQLLQFYMIDKGMHEGVERPVFEPIASGRQVTWKYRGQATPRNTRVQVEMEVVEAGRDERGPYAVADAWLWVDGMRVYHVQGLAVRVVSEPASKPVIAPLPERPVVIEEELTLDPAVDRWLGDHRPTFTVAVAPMMWMVEVLAQAARRMQPDWKVVRLGSLRIRHWLVCEEPRRLRVSSRALSGSNGKCQTRLEVWERSPAAPDGRWESVATAEVVLADRYGESAARLGALTEAQKVALPYASRAMFHGPAFHVTREVHCGRTGATVLLDAGDWMKGQGRLPVGLLHPALLDGLWHGLTRANVKRWAPDLPVGFTSYPALVETMDFFGDTPVGGEVVCEVRLDVWESGSPLVWFLVEMHHRGRLWMQARVAVILRPLGPFAGVSEEETAAFLEGTRSLQGVSLSSCRGGVTRLKTSAVRALDFLPGTLARAFGTSGDLQTLTLQVAVKEHLARTLGVHPAEVVVNDALLKQPGPIRIAWEGDEVVVSGSLSS